MVRTFLLIFLILYFFHYFLFFHCEAEGYLNALRFQDGIKPNNTTNTVLLRECSSSLLPGKKKKIDQTYGCICNHAICVDLRQEKISYREEQEKRNRSPEESVAHHLLDAIAEKWIYFYSLLYNGHKM